MNIKDFNLVVEHYDLKLTQLNRDNIFLLVYVKELEDRIAEFEEKQKQ